MLRIAIFLLLSAALCVAQTYDLVLANGRIVDGTGNPWYGGDIGIRGGRIAAIGAIAGGERRIDVGGRVVSPGFIDLMGASSLPIFEDPGAAISKIGQGITTILVGEGGSVAPQTEGTLGEATRWRTFAEYFRLFEAKGMAVNVVHNVGAAQVRRVVMGDEDRAPTEAELAKMVALVEDAMREGAAGVSTALIYPPGTYARTDELVALAKAAGRHGGFYSTHMRNESSQVLEAIAEALEIGGKAGVPVHIYHLKAAGQDNWPLIDKAIAAIASARARGLDVTADIYPYINNGLSLVSIIHPRHFAKGAEPFLKALAEDKAVRAEVRREMEQTSDWENWYRHVGKNWDNILIGQVHKGERGWEGRSIAAVARGRAEDPWNTFFELVARYRVQVNPRSMDERQKQLALRAPFVGLCTDAEPMNPASASGAHPRAFGAFPRVLAKYVREDRVIPLEEAIRKMTSLAANRLKLYDRGRIAPGAAADLVVFDPETIRDTADFAAPIRLPEGIDYVIVNGVVAMDHGRWTGSKSGALLTSRR